MRVAFRLGKSPVAILHRPHYTQGDSMRKAEKKAKQANTPEKLAKNAMIQVAERDMGQAGYPTTATVAITYMGITHEVKGGVNVAVKSGRIMLYFGSSPQTPLEFHMKMGDKVLSVEGKLQANFLTDSFIDEEDWHDIRDRYELPDLAEQAKVEEDAVLEAGETVA